MQPAEQAISDVSALPIEDQLRVVRAIWGSLPESASVSLSDDKWQGVDSETSTKFWTLKTKL